jgi:hypothetical protein
VHVLGWRRERWWALPLMFVLALPSIGINLGFNATHGWSNVMFNVFNRHEGSHWQLKTFAVYVGMAVYLLTPWLLWQGWRARAVPGVSPSVQRAAAVLWLFPIVLFAFLSLRRSVGLHWVLGFVPLFVVWAGLKLEPRALRRSLNWTLALSVPHLLLVAALAWVPLSLWQSSKLYEKAVFLREAPAIVQALQHDLPAGATLMARAYSTASMLGYFHTAYVPVFGVGRHHARQDDQLVDFRSLQGQRLRILDFKEPQLSDFTPYFERVSVSTFEVAGVRYFAVDGEGFRYRPYRDTVLSTIAREFHNIPTWLPLLGNPFCERYGFAECSPGGPGR